VIKGGRLINNKEEVASRGTAAGFEKGVGRRGGDREYHFLGREKGSRGKRGNAEPQL